jgi:hypothetical protein
VGFNSLSLRVMPTHRLTSSILVALLLGGAACPPVEPEPPTPEPWPLDVPLGAGEVRCGPVTAGSELLDGQLAYGQVGHAWVCRNDRIRFAIQGTERPFGNSSIGGNLIDAARVDNAEGEVGSDDEFREHVVAFGIHEVIPETIEVVDDGRSGEAGILRVTGTPGDLSLAPQAAFLAQPLPATVQTDYVLRPGSDTIEITTTLFNTSDDQLYGLLFADFVAFGSGNQTLSPTTGFDDLDFFQVVPFLAAGGTSTSYAWVCGDGADPTVIFAESGVTGPMCTDDIIVTTEASYTRLLVVGDGTLESVSRRAWEIKEAAVGTVTGAVTGADGEPAMDVYVAAIARGGPLDDGAYTVNRTRTAADGSYTLTLPADEEVVIAAYVPGEQRVQSDALRIEDGAAATVDLALAAPATVVLDVRFEDRAGGSLDHLPWKLTIEPIESGHVPSRVLGEDLMDLAPHSRPVLEEGAAIALAPGRYRLWASRGFEFTRVAAELDLAAGETSTFAATLQHVVDTTGLVGAEFHQHTLKSTDAIVPPALKVAENAAEGIEVAAATDHDSVNDFAPLARELGIDEHLTFVGGNEVSFQAIGHFNVYPWEVDPEDPHKDSGSRLWWGKSVPDLFDDVRRRAGDPVVQLNHVRRDGSGVLGAMLFNPIDGTRTVRNPPTLPGLAPDVYEDWPGQFDAIEINRLVGNPEDFTEEGRSLLSANASDDPSAIPALADFFGLLGAGFVVGGTANSDSHGIAEGVGWPRTLIDVGTDDPAAVTPAMITESVRGQRTSGSHGCLVEIVRGDERAQGLLRAVPSGARSELSLRVQAPDWAPMTQLELYANGRVLPLSLMDDALVVDDEGGALTVPLAAAAPGTADVLDVDLSGLPGGDLVLIAVARGGSLAPTAPSSTLCWSAPAYIVDGDAWTGWLE